ncbi:MAG: type II secretion system F family protein [Oscillospiraceae bacterium]|nr:type II secretion system F family protein [Oscillospiraceae bacterium]
MPNFAYVGIDGAGKEKKGSVEANDRERAIRAVRALGLTPVSIDEENFLNKDISFSIRKKTKPRDMALFCRQFASLLRAGVTIVESLNMLSESTENKGLAKAISGCAVSIQKGETLGISMREYPEYFNGMLISLVDAGEASGSLDRSLERMAVQYEKDAKLSGTVKKAMIYPIIVMIVAFGVLVLLLTVIVPQFMSMFEGMDIEMPAITVAVVNLSNYLRSHIIFVLAMVVAAVFALRVFKASARGQAIFGYIGVKIPALADFTVKSAAARLARTLSTLTGSGLQMTDALEITAHTMTNVLFKDALLDAKEEVLKGIPLSEPLKRSGLFPPMVVHMIKIGEDTGDMEAMLSKLADYYDEEVELATQQLLAALEPMIIIFLAVLVCFILYALFSPMLALYNGLDNL